MSEANVNADDAKSAEHPRAVRSSAGMKASLTTLLNATAVGCCMCLSLLTVLPVALVDATANGTALWGPGDDGGPGRIPGKHWCENITVGRFVRTPMNGYSALTFALFGWVVACFSRWDRKQANAAKIRNHLRCFFAANDLQVVVLLFGAFGSLINHSAVTHFSREPDRASVWALVTFPVFVAALRLFDVPARPNVYRLWAALLLIVNLSLTLFHLFAGDSSFATPLVYGGSPALVVLLLLLLAGRAVLARSGWRQRSEARSWLLALAFAFSALAYVLQNPATVGLCESPHVLAKTHGYWHVLQAAALFTFWLWAWRERVVVVDEREQVMSPALQPAAAAEASAELHVSQADAA